MSRGAIRNFLLSSVMRFAIVGVCNAAISFGILNLAYYGFHRSKIISSLFATVSALIFSFIMNRRFVFADKTRKIHHQFPVFAIVTISGTLLVLNVVYIISLKLLEGHEQLLTVPIELFTGMVVPASFIDINVSTVMGAVAAAFWNYSGYKRFVFKGSLNGIDEKA